MFINASAFKKLAKDSWERGVLVLSRKEDILLIQGASWIMAAQIDVVPNKIRAILVEMCGFLPDEGQTFRAGKGHENQYEFEQTIFWDWIDKAREDKRIQLRTTRAAWLNSYGTAIFLQVSPAENDEAAAEYLDGMKGMEVMD